MAGGALLSQLPIERFALGASASDTVKVALVGCGGRGSGAADQALKTEGSVKLVAMADAFKDRMDGSLRGLQEQHQDRPERIEVTDDHKFVGFDAYKAAIELADVVILATPPGFRPIHFEEAIRQGKHVFMEKPVAVDAPGVRRVLAAAVEAKRKNLKVGVGLQRHHQQPYIETVQRLHDGAIGDIVSMRCYWNGSGVWVRPRQRGQTEMEYQMRNWYYFNWLCGDHINEQHIHNIDVINWVKNAYPVRAQGMGGREVRKAEFLTDRKPIELNADTLDFGEIFDHHFVEFEYEDGTRMYSQCRHIPGCWSSVSEHVQGTRGSADVSGHVIRGENDWRFRGRSGNPYQVEHDDLFKAIRENLPFNEAENGAMSTMTSILGRMATYSGKMLNMDDALKSEENLMPANFDWDANPPVLPDANGLYRVAIPGKSEVV
jgi:predicted dehydrogenase